MATGLLLLADARALIEVEHVHLGDELLVHALRRLDDVAGRHRPVHHEGEVALHRLEGGEVSSGFTLVGLALGSGMRSSVISNATTGPATSSASSTEGLQFAEGADHVRAEAEHAERPG